MMEKKLRFWWQLGKKKWKENLEFGMRIERMWIPILSNKLFYFYNIIINLYHSIYFFYFISFLNLNHLHLSHSEHTVFTSFKNKKDVFDLSEENLCACEKCDPMFNFNKLIWWQIALVIFFFWLCYYWKRRIRDLVPHKNYYGIMIILLLINSHKLYLYTSTSASIIV